MSPGLQLGDYELLQEIGRGGMGVVYKARQRSLDRIVALKMILAGRFASQADVQRFRTEALAAGNLVHPNIVAVHEVGECEGHHFFSMDYVEGQNLAELVGNKPLPPNLAARYVRLIAQAVQYAHENSVIHRDLKPSNILVCGQDQLKLTDFGLAKRSVGTRSTASHSSSSGEIRDAVESVPTESLTLSGQVLGSPNFSSPEQAGGHSKTVGRESDIYSLGAILYFLITGRPPFLAESLEKTLSHVLSTDATAPSLINPSAPKDLETICLKCLEKEPSRRYPSAQALADDLARFEQDQPILARPVGQGERLGRWCRRNPALAAAILGVIVMFFAGFAGVLWQWQRAEQHARTERQQRQYLEQVLTHKEIQEAQGLFAASDVSSALARLARILRQDPTNLIAATRLWSALTHRNFALPVAVPLTHEATVVSAHFSPDGGRVVTGAADGAVRVWDAQTGRRLLDLPGHTARVRHAVFSPDGERIASASKDNTARVWDARTGEQLTPPLRHGGKIRRVHFSPDGKWVATASGDATARVWDSRTGLSVTPPLQHANYVNEAVFSFDGKWVATSSEDGTACVWDAQTGRRRGDPMQHGGDVLALRFSPDGERVVTASSAGTARVWSALSGQLLLPPLSHKAHVNFASFSPDGTKVVTASYDNTARVWEAGTGEPLTPPLVFESSLLRAEFSPDGRSVFAISDKGARLWDAKTGVPLTELILHEGRLEHLGGFSPEGGRVVTTSHDKTAIVWDVRPGTARPSQFSGAHADYGLAFSSDGRRVAAGTGRTFDVFVWDVGSGKMLAGPLRHPNKVNWFEFSPGGEHLISACRDGGARIWDLRSGRLARLPLRHQEGLHSAHFSQDGRRIVTASEDDTARIWDMDSGRELAKPLPHQSSVTWAEFSLAGRKIATASADLTARVWDATSGEPLTPPLRHESSVARAHFSPDGRWLLTTSQDTAGIWNAATGQSAGQRLAHRGPVLFAGFSSDGSRVLTASADGMARVWDAHTGGPLTEPLKHGAPLRVAHFSPDSTRVVTMSEEPITRIWDTASGHLLFEPLLHQGTVGDAPDARFAPDGNRLATVTPDGVLRLWDVPVVPVPTPAWFSELAETVAGKRFDAQGRSIPVSASRLVHLRQQLISDSSTNFYARWAKWFFADRSTRAASPFPPLSAANVGRRENSEK